MFYNTFENWSPRIQLKQRYNFVPKIYFYLYYWTNMQINGKDDFVFVLRRCYSCSINTLENNKRCCMWEKNRKKRKKDKQIFSTSKKNERACKSNKEILIFIKSRLNHRQRNVHTVWEFWWMTCTPLSPWNILYSVK